MKSARQSAAQLLRGLLRIWRAPSWWVETREREGIDDARHGLVYSGGRLFPPMIVDDSGRRVPDPDVTSWNPDQWEPTQVSAIVTDSIKYRRRSGEVRIILRLRLQNVGWKSATHWVDVLGDLHALGIDLHEFMLKLWHDYGRPRFDRMSATVSFEAPKPPKKRTPKKRTPKKRTPKKRTPKKRTPKKRTPKKRTPKKPSAPKKRNRR